MSLQLSRISAGALAPVALAGVLAVSAPGPALAQTPASANPAGPPALDATAPARSDPAVWGGGLRLRWVSVPGWLLGLFTKQNVPLSSYGVGAEFFRRQNDDLEMTFGLGYQNMSPGDGNWLGRGHAASIDTDFLQFRNLGLVGLDASFIWRTPINRYFGLRYGAGLGVAVVTGKILRVSAAGCTEGNVGDVRACRPAYCPATGCTEAQHTMREGPTDNGPGDAHRFSEPDVPPVLPILNVLAGIELRHPRLPGVEARLEGGFSDAFFLGLSVAYLF